MTAYRSMSCSGSELFSFFFGYYGKHLLLQNKVLCSLTVDRAVFCPKLFTTSSALMQCLFVIVQDKTEQNDVICSLTLFVFELNKVI